MPTLLHFHIYKNGGSTLDWILSRNFGSCFTTLHGEKDDSTLTQSDVSAFLSERPEICAVSSHHIRFPVSDIERLVPLLLIRHPVDRIVSAYEFARRAVPVGQSSPYLRSMTDWTRWAIENQPSTISDVQVNFLAHGGAYYEFPDWLSVVSAHALLSDLPFCGVVNLYDESMVLLEALVRRWWPKFDGAYFPQNQGMRQPLLSDRLAKIEAELGSEIFEQLSTLNRYDLELFEAASARLLSRLHALDSWENALRDLRGRCAALR